MGMFTTIVDENNKEYQIKCGMDNCETYKIGDNVGQYPSKDWAGAGYLLDDVYYAHADDHCFHYYVIIKDGVVKAVEAMALSVDDDGNDAYSVLKKKYDVQDPPRTLWSEELWEEKRKAEERSQKEFEDYKGSVGYDSLSKEEQMGVVLSYPIKRALKMESISRKVLGVEQLSVLKNAK